MNSHGTTHGTTLKSTFMFCMLFVLNFFKTLFLEINDLYLLPLIKHPETRGGINFYNIFQNNVKQYADQRL